MTIRENFGGGGERLSERSSKPPCAAAGGAAAEAGRAQETPAYNEAVVRLFTIAALFWGVAAFLVGVYLVWVGGMPIVAVGLASLACAVAYTGGPFPLAYNGLGDLFVTLIETFADDVTLETGKLLLNAFKAAATRSSRPSRMMTSRPSVSRRSMAGSQAPSLLPLNPG